MCKYNIPVNERIIFALDFKETEIAKKWVRKLDSKIKFFKVGLQLFLAGGWEIINYISSRNNKVMLDLKFFDIPVTIKLAIEQLKKHNINFATIHGNDDIIKAATSEKTSFNILAITVLTSFDQSDLQHIGATKSIKDLVLVRAKKAIELGCAGLVSSAEEAKIIRNNIDKDFIIVTPGIRIENNNIQQDDQKRITTAKQAILNGSDYLVIGRPISLSSNPLYTVQKIQADIEQAL